eukprot:GHVS01062036.1.p2 GENE.GHVS01062036.1~~GHVS01062036.1.p2  ORF type:complete len:119 (+),score=16.54 GHVS01062036.1:318-674(+)
MYFYRPNKVMYQAYYRTTQQNEQQLLDDVVCVSSLQCWKLSVSVGAQVSLIIPWRRRAAGQTYSTGNSQMASPHCRRRRTAAVALVEKVGNVDQINFQSNRDHETAGRSADIYGRKRS